MTEPLENSGAQPNVDTAAETPGGTTPAGNSETQGEGNNAALELTWKKNLEKERATVRELQERLERIERERRTATPAPNGESDPRAKREQRVRSFAEQDDPVAAEVLELRQQLSDVISGVSVMSQINAIEDADERAEVRKRYLASLEKGSPVDVRTVRAETRAERTEAENSRLREQLAKSAAKQPDKDVVRTHTREVPASETKAQVMTRAQWDARVAELRATQGDNAVRAFKRDTVNDKIVIRG
jgi:hypothetical protein